MIGSRLCLIGDQPSTAQLCNRDVDARTGLPCMKAGYFLDLRTFANHQLNFRGQINILQRVFWVAHGFARLLARCSIQ